MFSVVPRSFWIYFVFLLFYEFTITDKKLKVKHENRKNIKLFKINCINISENTNIQNIRTKRKRYRNRREGETKKVLKDMNHEVQLINVNRKMKKYFLLKKGALIPW